MMEELNNLYLYKVLSSNFIATNLSKKKMNDNIKLFILEV